MVQERILNRSWRFLREKKMNYFSYRFKKATNFGKLYHLLKIHKRLYNVPGRSVFLICGRPTEKCSEVFENHLKTVKKEKGCSYIKDLINKTKNLLIVWSKKVNIVAVQWRKKLNKELVMTKKDKEDFENSTKCWICDTVKSTTPDNVILVAADVVGLCPKIHHEVDLRALREALGKQDKKSIFC